MHDPVCPSDNCSRRKPSVPESDTVNDSGERVMVLTLTGEIEYWHPDCYELRPN